MTDRFDSHETGLNSPADDGFDITPGASELAVCARAVYVGGAGDVEITTAKGTTLVFSSVPAGTTLPVRASYVLATNTTATNLIGLL